MNPKDIVREGYNRVSSAYRGDGIDPASPEFVQYGGWVGELLGLLPAGADVLDLGCGNGLPTAWLLCQAGCRVRGVDLSPVQIERARRLVPQASLLCADMTALELPEASLDAVVSFYAIIHVPLAEQPALFARIHSWLRPGGYLMATVGADAWTGSEEDWLGVPGGRMYWSHTDAATYQQWMAEGGFSVLQTRFIPEGGGGHTLLLAQRV